MWIMNVHAPSREKQKIHCEPPCWGRGLQGKVREFVCVVGDDGGDDDGCRYLHDHRHKTLIRGWEEEGIEEVDIFVDDDDDDDDEGGDWIQSQSQSRSPKKSQRVWDHFHCYRLCCRRFRHCLHQHYYRCCFRCGEILWQAMA